LLKGFVVFQGWMKNYDIHEGIESSLILLNNKIKDRITIHRDYGEFEDLECYPSKFNQVVMNILTNCIQAIEGKGDIHIQSVGSETGVKISIKDNGKGMTPEVKKHIFEPFYTTKDVGKGTGLGLSISFGIIEQHNGNIDVMMKSITSPHSQPPSGRNIRSTPQPMATMPLKLCARMILIL